MARSTRNARKSAPLAQGIHGYDCTRYTIVCASGATIYGEIVDVCGDRAVRQIDGFRHNRPVRCANGWTIDLVSFEGQATYNEIEAALTAYAAAN